MINRMEVIDKWSKPILNWLMTSLPYHAEPYLMKRYIKIITNLAYSIRESGYTNQIKSNNFQIKLFDDDKSK